MTRPPNRISAVGVSWYRPETYDSLRAMMADPEVLPATYEKFLYRALKQEEQQRAAGLAVIRVHLDADEFPGFCRERGLDLNAQGRMAFAAFKAAEMIEARHAGNA